MTRFHHRRRSINRGRAEFVIVNGRDCLYCGEVAEVRDHVLPLNRLEVMTPAEVMAASDLLLLVPACRECNGWLNSQFFPTLDARQKAVQEHYVQKYRRILSMPDWSLDDLEELGPTLRRHVRAGLQQRERQRRRIVHPPASGAI